MTKWKELKRKMSLRVLIISLSAACMLHEPSKFCGNDTDTIGWTDIFVSEHGRHWLRWWRVVTSDEQVVIVKTPGFQWMQKDWKLAFHPTRLGTCFASRLCMLWPIKGCYQAASNTTISARLIYIFISESWNHLCWMLYYGLIHRNLVLI